jgi:hypothetical protein
MDPGPMVVGEDTNHWWWGDPGMERTNYPWLAGIPATDSDGATQSRGQDVSRAPGIVVAATGLLRHRR